MRINNTMYEIHHAILVRAHHITVTIDYILIALLTIFILFKQ